VNVPVVCSIGCSDPWNAAGLGLDITALRACAVRPVMVVAGVTAQDRRGVHSAAAVSPELIAAQLDALRDAGIATYRIGALLDEASVEAVAVWLERTRAPAVYDPVLAPSAGGTFAGGAVIAAIARRLMPLVTLATPNFSEARELACQDEPGARAGSEAMERVARVLVARGASAILVTGGDLPGAALDVLVDEDGCVAFEGPRFPGTMRGTGCLLSCGIAAALAHGQTVREAVISGRAFVRARFEAGAIEAGGMRLAY
jgi:hydroxymethylpyrimidine/phosphomethylpyrimidine kinase